MTSASLFARLNADLSSPLESGAEQTMLLPRSVHRILRQRGPADPVEVLLETGVRPGIEEHEGVAASTAGRLLQLRLPARPRADRDPRDLQLRRGRGVALHLDIEVSIDYV